jgi:outer membrane receptor protein involved in Fe transport
MRRHSAYSALASLVIGLVVGSPAASAQTAPGATAVEEIVVTTRRRAENLQDVPIAIDVLTAEFIKEAGIRRLEDIVKFSPSVQFDRAFSQNSVRVAIRGLSNTRGRANVAFLVDGIDVTSETTGTNAGSPLLVNQRLLTDVERIEVVKGPQSALYGRAAFAGAINYITAEPGDSFESNVSLDFAEDGFIETSGGVSLPLSDTLGVRLTGVYWEDDGHYPNVTSGEEFDGGDGYGAAATTVWRPIDGLKFKGRLSWTDDDYEPGAVASLKSRQIAVPLPADAAPVTSTTEALLVPRVGDASGLAVHSSEDPLTGSDYPGNELEVFRASLVATWNVGAYTLSSYTGYTDADMSQRYDLDRQSADNPDTLLGHGEVDTVGDTQQISQEIRLASSWENSPIQITVGGLYWDEERDDHSRNIAAVCFDSAACFADGFSSWQELYAEIYANTFNYREPRSAETEHRSAYAMLEWSITESLKLTLEDRYTDEDFEATVQSGASCVNAYPSNLNCLPGVTLTGENGSDYHTPKVTVDWRASESVLFYASAGKGVKPAGISLLTLPIPFILPLDPYFFDEEELWAYEIGAKTDWTGDFGALVFNAAAFYQDYTDKQTNTQQEVFAGFVIGVVSNASSATAFGIELEASWQTPLDGLTLGLGYTWLDTEYDDFKDATRSSSRIAIAGTCGEVVDIGGIPHCELDLSGNELEFAPEHSLLLTGNYSWPVPGTDFSLFTDWNVKYTDERFTSADNFTKLDDYWLADWRAGLSGEKWSFIGYVDNVFDEDTISSSGGNIDLAEGYVDSGSLAPPGLPTAFLPRPRTFGIRLLYNF